MATRGYGHNYAGFKRSFADFCAISQLAGALIVLSSILLPTLRDKLVWKTLGLFWALVGLNYYWRTVGGLYGEVMAAVCAVQCLGLWVNWERLRVFGELSLTTQRVLPLQVDLKTVNATVGCLGAFSLPVRLT